MPSTAFPPSPVATNTHSKDAPLSKSLAFLRAEPVDTEQGILIPALLFTEGKITDAAGNTNNFKAKHLKEIADGTTAYYTKGETVWLFNSNHDLDGPYKAGDIIGQLAVGEGLAVEEITAENLPDERFSDLIGLQGLFGKILITNDEAIQQYRNGNLKPISIAFDPSGEWTGEKFSIYEVSAVPWGAVRGAMMYSRIPGADIAPVKYALTLDGAIAESEPMPWTAQDEEFDDLIWAVHSVIRNVQKTTDEELQGRSRPELISQAIDDLRTRLREVLGVARDAPPPVSVNAAKPKGEPPMADDLNPIPVDEQPVTPEPKDAPTVDMSALEARIAALEATNADLSKQAESAQAKADELEELQKVGELVAAQRQRADGLVLAGKLKPAEFNRLFPELEAPRAMAQRFAKPVEDNKFSGPTGLICLETYLDAVEQRPAVQFGSQLKASAPLGANPYRDQVELSENDKAISADVANSAARNKAY